MYVALGLLDHDPYWAALWPSSIALARGVAAAAAADTSGDLGQLRRRERRVRPRRGIRPRRRRRRALRRALRGLHDREPLALQCCLLSAELNGLTVRAGGPHEVKDARRDSTDVDDVLGFGGDVRLERGSRGSAPFDLVLACDVLYESHAVAPVASLVPKLTVPGGGRWLLADPPNRAPKNRARFRELVAGDATLLGNRERNPSRTEGPRTRCCCSIS